MSIKDFSRAEVYSWGLQGRETTKHWWIHEAGVAKLMTHRVQTNGSVLPSMSLSAFEVSWSGNLATLASKPLKSRVQTTGLGRLSCHNKMTPQNERKYL